MSENTQIHLSADLKDFSCPICYCVFDQIENQPISTNCGHTICSTCFDKVTKCPLCKMTFNKTQKHQKSVVLSSLIANNTKKHICKEHSMICQGVCSQDKVFVCFDCIAKNHHGHKIITMNDVNEKTKNLKKGTQKARETEEMQGELRGSIETESKNHKRKLDEIIDPEVFQLSMLKKMLFKDLDILTSSDEEQQEHKLLAENLSKYRSNTEKMLGDWDKNQEADLAIQIFETPEEYPETQKLENKINLFRTSVVQKQKQFMIDFMSHFSTISYSSAKVKELFLHNKQADSAPNHYQRELGHLIGVFRLFYFTVSLNNNILKLKNDGTKRLPPEFDSTYFTCSLSKISLNCSDLFSWEFKTIYKILQSVLGLKDLTLQLRNIDSFKLLRSNLKNFENLQVEMDLNVACRSDVNQFIEELISQKNLSNLNIQSRERQTIISAQLTSVGPENFLEIDLNIEGISEVICETLNMLKIAQPKSLKVFRLFFGKTECKLQVLEVIPEALSLQKKLEELTLTCENLNDDAEMDFSLILGGLTQQKKLGIFVKNVSLPNEKSPTNFMVSCHLQDLEEFTFKIKCGSVRNPDENFERFIEFLANSKILKKLCLQFDGIHLTMNPTQKLFNQIVKLQTLASLEIEFLNFNSFNPSAESKLESILNNLPDHVIKKCTFSKPNSQQSPLDQRDSFVYL